MIVNKLLLSRTFSFFMLLFTGSILLTSSFIIKKQLLENKKKLMRQLVQEKSSKPQAFFASYKNQLNKLIQDPQTIAIIKNTQPSQELTTTYETLIKSLFTEDSYSDIFLVAMDNKISFALNNKTIQTEQLHTPEFSLAINLALATLSPQLSPFIIDPTTNTPFIYLTQSILAEDKLLGTVIVKINPAKLLEEMTNINQLGKTGEVLLGNITEKEKMYLVRPRKIIDTKQPLPHDQKLFDASHGSIGTDQTKDYRQAAVIASWDYLAETNIGIVVKQDINEIIAFPTMINTIALIFFGLACLLFLSMLASRYQRDLFMHKIAQWQLSLQTNKDFFIRFILFGFLGLSIFAFLYTLHTYQQENNTAHNIAQAKQVLHLRSVTQDINRVFYQMEAVAQQIKQQAPESINDIEAVIKTTLEQNPLISGICIAFEPNAYKASPNLYAPYSFNKNKKIETQQISSFYNYKQSQHENKFNNIWYTTPSSSQKPLWSLGSINGIAAHESLIYSIPFYAQKDAAQTLPIGVIAITYLLSSLNKTFEKFELASAGKSIVITHDGRFVHHPEKKYTIERQAITDVVKSNEESLDYKKLLAQYLTSTNAHASWNIFETIPSTNWIIGANFPQSEAIRKIDFLSSHIKMVCMFVLMILLLIIIITKLWFNYGLLVTICSYSCIMLGSNMYLWTIINQRPFVYPTDQEIIDDPIILEHIIHDRQRKATEANQSSYQPIRTGLSLSSLNISITRDASFTGFFWQKYNTEQSLDKTIQAISFSEMQKLSMQETVRHQKDSDLFIGWDVTAANNQSYKVTEYPFVMQHVKINLIQKEQLQNLMPVPDFESYTITKNNPYPWIEKSLPGLETSYFSYKKLSSEKKVVNQLTINVVIKADLMQAIIGFLLPILVTLIAAFAAFWIYPISYRLGAYSGLCFSAILVQRALREKVMSDQMVYLEFFIIFTYITLFCLTIAGIIQTIKENKAKTAGEKIVSEESSDKISLILTYWPIQFTAWFITTVWFFV